MRLKVFVLIALSSVAVCNQSASASELITEQEARLPAAAGATAMNARGITRGPKVVVVSPSNTAFQKSPVALAIKFEAFGGAKIDRDAVRVTYLKNPIVDLTKRIASDVTETGINLTDASVPPGDHQIRVDIKDSEGRTGSAIFSLKIAP